MKTEILLLGIRISMASRRRRRMLVVIFYSVFAAIFIPIWMTGHYTRCGFFTIIYTMLVGSILGGNIGKSLIYDGPGLVTPFEKQKRLIYPESASILRPSTLLHPIEENDPEIRIDERSMHRRDHAHYKAYQTLSLLIGAGFILEFCSRSGWYEDMQRLGMTSNIVHQINYGLLQIGMVLVATEPQAILLWTEPDMETGADEE